MSAYGTLLMKSAAVSSVLANVAPSSSISCSSPSGLLALTSACETWPSSLVQPTGAWTLMTRRCSSGPAAGARPPYGATDELSPVGAGSLVGVDGLDDGLDEGLDEGLHEGLGVASGVVLAGAEAECRQAENSDQEGPHTLTHALHGSHRQLAV